MHSRSLLPAHTKHIKDKRHACLNAADKRQRQNQIQEVSFEDYVYVQVLEDYVGACEQILTNLFYGSILYATHLWLIILKSCHFLYVLSLTYLIEKKWIEQVQCVPAMKEGALSINLFVEIDDTYSTCWLLLRLGFEPYIHSWCNLRYT